MVINYGQCAVSCQLPEYVSSGMLLYLDGRDAPVSGAWVDRVSGQRCAISGATISHIADERCYSKSGSEKDRITMPDGILKATQLYTVQCVANDMRSEKGNGAFISIHAMQNIENSQFSIWQWDLRLQYHIWSNGVNFEGMLCPATTNEIHSLSGSRNGGSTCRSFYSGVFETANVSYQGSGSGGNYLFSDESWYIAQAKIYCVRIYNRVLTDSEILHNYDVDKKIFKSL